MSYGILTQRTSSDTGISSQTDTDEGSEEELEEEGSEGSDVMLVDDEDDDVEYLGEDGEVVDGEEGEDGDGEVEVGNGSRQVPIPSRPILHRMIRLLIVPRTPPCKL
ncbi:hypothetical protein EYR40_001539 [Pleurotus pulmonarius]|nr:hypothetical protein EYR40_001539 [Pleurotus pulmonarius]